ncbi:hypothetical protein RJT34_26225 [Clitoria ternatea]|uniref:Uncharacterized protein n=1 Tax=Clitoria ternatea TaxID=43366 RepID=A0AAN9FFB3_CLITE
MESWIIDCGSKVIMMKMRASPTKVGVVRNIKRDSHEGKEVDAGTKTIVSLKVTDKKNNEVVNKNEGLGDVSQDSIVVPLSTPKNRKRRKTRRKAFKMEIWKGVGRLSYIMVVYCHGKGRNHSSGLALCQYDTGNAEVGSFSLNHIGVMMKINDKDISLNFLKFMDILHFT